MTQNFAEVNENDKKTTIRRGRHDKDRPYVMISKAMLQDQNLSPRDKGALCYLLSLPDDWITHPRQVAKALAISKNQMYSILKALILAGYATKESPKDSHGKFEAVTYYFYEEKLAVPQEIKIKSTVSQNQDTGFKEKSTVSRFGDTEKGTLLKNNLKDNIFSKDKDLYIEDKTHMFPPNSEPVDSMPAEAGEHKVESSKKKKIKRRLDTFNLEVLEVSQKMLEILRRCNPVYRPPDDLIPFFEAVELMVQKDMQDIALLLRTFEWACQDNERRGEFPGWQSILITNVKGGKPTNPAIIFRKYFDKLHSSMKSKKERKFAPCSDDDKAYAAIASMNATAI